MEQSSLLGKNQERNSAIELLRIVAMFLIVLSHACFHSRFDIVTSVLNFNKLFVQWGFLGNLGVAIYALVSGYYLSMKTEIHQSLIRLLLQVWFYSYTLFFVCKFGLKQVYSLNGYLQAFFPTIFQEYWFFTVYFILGIFLPWINMFIQIEYALLSVKVYI